MAWALVLPLVPPARAQISPAVPTADDEPRNPVGEAWSLGSIPPPDPADWSQPRQVSANTGSNARGSLLDVAYQSLFGDAYSEAARAAWRPLRLRTFFRDGWNEPYIEPPAGSGGAPRSGWVNSFEGTFFRSWFLSFSFASQGNRNGNHYLGNYTIYAPLNRRFELRIDVPFIESTKGAARGAYHNRFGDLVVSPRFLLSATRDFTQLLAVNIRTPTGSQLNGKGVGSLSPHYQFWYNPYGNWAVRGGTGVTVPTNGVGGGTSYFTNLGVGRYWKGADDGLLRHQWLTLVTNFNTSLSGGAPSPTYLSVTPGYRVQVHNDWSFLAGVEVPLTNHSPFVAQPMFFLVKAY